MPKVSTNKLKPGMIVASSVVDREAQVVIRSQEALTEQHITLLKMWGIAEVEIMESNEELSIELLYSQHTKAIVDEVMELAAQKFTLHSDDCSVSRLLKKMFILEELNRRAVQ